MTLVAATAVFASVLAILLVATLFIRDRGSRELLDSLDEVGAASRDLLNKVQAGNADPGGSVTAPMAMPLAPDEPDAGGDQAPPPEIGAADSDEYAPSWSPRPPASGQGGQSRTPIAADAGVARSGGVLRKFFRFRRDRLQQEDPRLVALSKRLNTADISLFPREWIALQFIAGLFAGVVAALLLDSWIFFPLGCGGVVVGAIVVVRRRQNRKDRLFAEQIGDMLSLLSGALRSGQSFDGAMQSIIDDALPPMRNELQRYAAEIALGVTTGDALSNMLKRHPSKDLRIAVRSILMSRQVGGSLAEILDNIADTVRTRIQISQEIRAATAQARISGWIIALLPVGVSLVLMVIDPSYFAPMLNTQLGVVLLCGSVVSIVAGGLIIRKIVDIRV